MSAALDPPRLADARANATEAARAFIERSRAEVPDAEQIARIASRLPLTAPSPRFDRPRAAPPEASLSAAPAAASVLPGAVIGAALALALLGGAWLRAPATASPSAGPVSTARPEGTTEPTASATPRADASPSAVASSAARGSEVTAPQIAPDPEPQHAAPAPPSSSAPPRAAGSAAGGTLESEVQLLSRAHRMVSSDPAGALALLEEHRRRFRGGALAEEREVLAIQSLLALGRRDEARSRGARFLAAHPQSAHRPGLEARLGKLAD
ncbi:MAG: hypothetical protein QM820_19675 [Minicystis sp.]